MMTPTMRVGLPASSERTSPYVFAQRTVPSGQDSAKFNVVVTSLFKSLFNLLVIERLLSS